MHFKAFQLFSPPLLVTLMNLKGFLKLSLCGCTFKLERESEVPSPWWRGWTERRSVRRAPAGNQSQAGPSAAAAAPLACLMSAVRSRVTLTGRFIVFPVILTTTIRYPARSECLASN